MMVVTAAAFLGRGSALCGKWTPEAERRQPAADLLSAHGAAIGVYILIVFFHGAGEAVVAGRVGYEIVVVTFRGMHRGFQSASAGIADGAGRKSRISVCIVGRLELHVVVMQRALIRAGQEFGVNNAGVGIESDLLRETVVVNAGHERALFRDCCFFLDD